MTVNLEETLTHFVRWVRHTHLTERNLDFAQATIDNISAVGMWIEQLPDDTDAPEPGKFISQSKFKTLVENIKQYLSIAKNNAGVPLSYTIRINEALPPAADDPGAGLPSFDIELSTRGRHDGVFWRASNRLVWNMLRTVWHGTEAWFHGSGGD